jgi:hypothetical protein
MLSLKKNSRDALDTLFAGYPAGYPAGQSGIQSDTGYQKRPDYLAGRISGASLKNYLLQKAAFRILENWNGSGPWIPAQILQIRPRLSPQV